MLVALCAWLVGACSSPGCPAGSVEFESRCRTVGSGTAGDVGNAGGFAEAVAGASADGALGNATNGTAAAGSGARNVTPTAGTYAGVAGTGAWAGSPGMSGGAVDPCQGHAQSSVCRSATMLHCDAAGLTASMETCTDAMSCALGQPSGKCAACSPGTFRCTGETLEVCSDNGQYGFKETCASVDLCKEKAGACTTQLCTPNSNVCDADGNLQTCSADGSALTTIQACGKGMCDNKLGTCYKCIPNARACNGAGFTVCTPDGQTQEPTACPEVDCQMPACMDGECVNVQAPKQTKCASANVCNDAGKCVGCVADSDCGPDELCSGETCLTKACMPNMAVCTSTGALQVCDATGATIANMKLCGPGLCDQAGQSCFNCVPGAKSCRGDAAVTCDASGARESETRCEPQGDAECSTASCSNGACLSSNRPRSAGCTGGGKCDGAGHCVPCLTGDTQPCTDVPSGQCGPGTQACSGNRWGACTGKRASEDSCDGSGIDSDCDGKVDEVCTSQGGRACSGTSCVISGDFGGCNKCTQSGSSLTCNCANGSGKWSNTTVNLSGCGGKDPVNCSGQLSCKDCWQLIVDQGSFDNSCTNCKYNYKSVTCDCKNNAGETVSASTYDLPCERGLYNDNGTLKCAGR